MNNLLPPKEKQTYEYGKRNVQLVQWAVVFAITLIGLFIIGTAGLIYMQRRADSYQHQISSMQTSLARQKLTQTQTQARDISNSLKLAIKVLGQEVLFSKLLKQLATVTPHGVSLSTLTITQGTTALNLTAQTATYADATQLQVNLADPANKIFSKADIVSITCSSEGSTQYPCTVQIQALFAKQNPFLFINSGGSS
jgi:Tfp pilus assembly protein PilN